MTLMVDGIMLFVILEAAFLVIRGRAAILPDLCAGLMLLIAMRLALGNAGLPWVGISLLAAGLAHLADLRQRWNR